MTVISWIAKGGLYRFGRSGLQLLEVVGIAGDDMINIGQEGHNHEVKLQSLNLPSEGGLRGKQGRSLWTKALRMCF
jgi:hypothetical protein